MSLALHSSGAAREPRMVVPELAPRRNHLLAALPKAEYARLLPHLQPVHLPPGKTLHGAGAPEESLCFITAGLVCRLQPARGGTSAEFALTGREGVIGLASFLGGERTPSQAVVLNAGEAYRLELNALNDELKRHGALTHLLLRYTLALLAETGQTAVCNRHHSLEQQLCRWLLSVLDRLPCNEIKMTQTLIARMLGVRRESVTQAAGHLQEAGLIRYSRGRIVVLDRRALEGRACECYAVVKRECERLLPGHRQAPAYS